MLQRRDLTAAGRNCAQVFRLDFGREKPLTYRKLLAGVVAACAVAGAWQALDAADAGPSRAAASEVTPVDRDPYLWLAKIHGQRATDWVKAQNAKSNAVLKTDPNYARTRATILAMLNAKDRIAEPRGEGQVGL